MVVCKFFREGYCRYGSDCRFEHTNSSKYTYHAPAKSTPTPVVSSVSTEKIVAQVADEVRAVLNGGQWLLTCYAPFSRKNFPGFVDISPEEARLAVYEAKAGNTVDQAIADYHTLVLEANGKYRKLLQPDSAIANTLKSVYLQESAQDPFGRSTAKSAVLGGSSTTSLFGGQSTPASVFGGQNQSAQSVFGGQSHPSTAASVFGVQNNAPSPQSVFGTQNNQSPQSVFVGNPQSPQSVFGAQNSSPSPQSVFGSQISSPNPQSVFGTQNSPQSVFAGPTNHSSATSAFSPQINSPSPQSVFGAQNSSPNPQSVFGAQNIPTNPQSVFGAQNTSPNPQSVFGAQNNAPSPQSVFGTQNNQSPQSVFGAPSASAAAQSVFGSQQPNAFAASPHPFGSTGQDVFSKQTPQAINSQSPFGGTLSTESVDITVYRKIEELSAEDLEQFKSDRFEFGFIPELPPPQALCF